MQASKTKSGKWRARAYNKYTNTRKSFTADSKKEAERLARQYEYNIKKETTGITFGEAYDLYIQSHPKWSVRTIADYTRWKDTRYNDFLNLKLEEMTDSLLQQWIDKLIPAVSAKTAINYFSPISATLNRYRKHIAVKVDLPKKDKKKLRLPSEAEVMELLKGVEGTRFYIPLLLGAVCAMRRGETVSLTMDHINFEDRTIFIEYNKAKDKHGKWQLKPPKNGCTRTITVPQLAIDKIKEYGIPEIENPDNLSSLFSRHRERHKLPNYNFHSMRHYCAAQMLANNIPISVVQEYGGWKNKTVLLEIYDYVIKEVRDKSLDKWNELANQFGHKLDANPENP